MSQFANIITGVSRTAETGHVLVEVCSGGNLVGLEIPQRHLVRVSAIGVSTVLFNGVLACSLQAGEVVMLNSGMSKEGEKRTITLSSTGTCYIQVAKEVL